MGWSAHDLPNRNWKLWTRGGTEGVYIAPIESMQQRAACLLKLEIEIPSELIRMLVASEIKSERISQLEQMDDDEILK